MEDDKKNQQQPADSLLEAKHSGTSNKQDNKPANKLVVLAVGLVVLVLVVIGVLLINKKHTSTESGGRAVAEIIKPASVQPAQVSITKTGFVPQSVTIVLGQAVVWKNNDTTAHVVASDPYPSDSALPGLNSEQDIQPGSSYSYTFGTLGTYSYHDNLNPFSLKGTVIVKQ